MKPLVECLADGESHLKADEELALLHALEATFVALHREGKLAEDRPCAVALESLDRSLEGGGDEGETAVFLRERLREFLNQNEGRYARADVRRACRKVRKSVERHRNPGVPDAYLRFIGEFIV